MSKLDFSVSGLTVCSQPVSMLAEAALAHKLATLWRFFLAASVRTFAAFVIPCLKHHILCFYWQASVNTANGHIGHIQIKKLNFLNTVLLFVTKSLCEGAREILRKYKYRKPKQFQALNYTPTIS